MNRLKEAAKETWWYRLGQWIKKIYTPEYTWSEVVEDMEEEEQKND